MLTPKQERFCQNLEVKRMSQRVAYIDAYPKAKDWKMSTVDENACRLANSSKIKARREELRQEQSKEIAKEAKWTRQDAFKTLNKLIAKAEEEIETRGEMASPNVSAIINAVKELNAIYEVTAEKTETEKDGFIEALNGQAKEVWNDEEHGDIPI
jgi:L-lactate utilization protein LutB